MNTKVQDAMDMERDLRAFLRSSYRLYVAFNLLLCAWTVLAVLLLVSMYG